MKRILALLTAGLLAPVGALAQPVDLASILPPGRLATGGATDVVPGLYERVEIMLDWRETLITADQILARPTGLLAFDVTLRNDRGTLQIAEFEADLAALGRLNAAVRDMPADAMTGTAGRGAMRLKDVVLVRSGPLESRLTAELVRVTGWQDASVTRLVLEGVEVETPTGTLRAGRLDIVGLPLTMNFDLGSLAVALDAIDLVAEAADGTLQASVAELSAAVRGPSSAEIRVREAHLPLATLHPLEFVETLAALGVDPMLGSARLSVEFDAGTGALRFAVDAEVDDLGQLAVEAQAIGVDLSRTVPLQPLGLPVSVPIATLVSAAIRAEDAGFGTRAGIVWPDLLRRAVPGPFLDRLPILREAATRLEQTGTVALAFQPSEPVTVAAALGAALMGNLGNRLGARLD